MFLESKQLIAIFKSVYVITWDVHYNSECESRHNRNLVITKNVEL